MAEPPSAAGAVEHDHCWCCGAARPDDELLRLGDHPEVGVCHDCARFLHRRAMARADARRPSLAGAGRSLVGTLRDRVVAHGLQDRRGIGPLLRRLDRHLP